MRLRNDTPFCIRIKAEIRRTEVLRSGDARRPWCGPWRPGLTAAVLHSRKSEIVTIPATGTGIAPEPAAWLRSGTRALLPFVALASLAACEFPTSAPQFEQTWVIPLDSTRLVVDELLPPGLVVAAGAFRFTPAPTTISRTLGSMCSCSSSATPVPKPAFSATVSGAITLGTDLLSATTAPGSVFRVTLSHTFNFDPIRPSAGAGSQRGWFVIELRSGGAVIGRDSVNGATTAWLAGTPLVRDVPLSGGVVLAAGATIPVAVSINSPAGDPVAINTTQTMTIVAQPSNLGVTNVRVRVINKTVSAVNIPLDVSDVSDDFTKRIVNGGMLFTITNPFAIAGSMTMTITIPGQTAVVKTLPITAAVTSSPTIDFTGEELDRILGSEGVNLALSGTVSGPAAGVSVSPGQALGIANRIRMTILVGG